MLLSIRNSTVLVEECTPDEHAWLADYLSVEDTRYKPKRRGATNENPRDNPPFCAVQNNSFPTGLLHMVRKQAERDSITLVEADTRAVPCAPDALADTAWLRDYQLDAVNSVMARGGRGIVKAPTGAGKTEISIALTRVYNCGWLFVVDSADLVVQAAERYEQRTGERAGRWSGWRKGWEKGTANFTVATFQSLNRAFKDWRKGKVWLGVGAHIRELVNATQALCVDEVHTQSADTYYSVTQAFKNAYYRIGLSGTPLDRAGPDNLMVLGAIGPILYKIDRQRLVDAKVLSDSKIRMIPCRQGASKAGTDWATVYDWWICKSDPRNAVIVEMAVKAEKPAMLFVDRIEHIAQLRPLLEAAGLKVDVATGKHWTQQRKEKLNALEAGEVDVLMCTVIFQKGIDAPKLRSVINAAGKASAVATLQRIGRGMRVDVDTNKYSFEVWDVHDQGQRWLQKHAVQRLSTYQADGHTVFYGWDEVELEVKPEAT